MINYQNTPIIQSYTYTYPKSVFTTLNTNPINLIPPQSGKLVVFWGLSFINNSGSGLTWNIDIAVSTPYYASLFNFISNNLLYLTTENALYHFFNKVSNLNDEGLYQTQISLYDKTLQLYASADNPAYILQNDFKYTLYYSLINI